jgi:predicted dehydrogenase
MTDPIRIGVIGAGSFALASHLPRLAGHGDRVRFVGVSRKGAEMLELVRERYGFAVASEDYRDVLAAGVDACVVASPAALHHEHAKAALEAGAHVLVEKPVTLAPSDAWDLVQAAADHDRHLLCAFGWNYKQLLRAARDLMATHGVGPIEHVSVRMASFTRELLSGSGAYPKASADSPPEAGTWIDPALSGGGYAQAQLTHALGAALWITGLRGERVFAFMGAPDGAPVELHDAIAIQYEGGAIGALSGASTHVDAQGVPENELDIHVVGRDGQFALDVANGRCYLARREDRWEIDVGEEGGRYDCHDPIDALVELAGGGDVENCAPGELGARTVEILAGAYDSARTGAPAGVARP